MFYKLNSSLILALILFSITGCGRGNSSFNPRNPVGAGPALVDLHSSGNYVVLAKSSISNFAGSNIIGDVGLSPATGASITGLALTLDATNVFSTSAIVTGNVYAADYAAPTPANLATAVLGAETAYTMAEARNPADFSEIGAGNIGGFTLPPGLYKWTTAVTIPSNLNLAGNPADVWIFQVNGNLSLSSGITINLLGGALPENIFWQVSGAVTLNSNSHFEGIILGRTGVTLQSQAAMNGRILAQGAIALNDNVITEP
ncbi:MAG: ice-binding family protein [Bacteriovorax sp.]|jgi:hypothetical protein